MESTNKKEKQTNKIEYTKALELLVNGLDSIRASNESNKAKYQKERRLGNSALIVLRGRKSRAERNKASLSYYNRKVTQLRTKIRDLGYTRHDINEQLDKLETKYPPIQKEIETLREKPIREAEDRKKDAIKNVEARIKRTTNKNKLSELRKAKKGLQDLKLEPVLFLTLVRTNEERDELKEAANKRVTKYHSEPRVIDYSQCYELMAKHLVSNNWESLTFALCLASGRRCTEILCLEDGRFQKKGNSKMEAIFTTSVKTKEAKTFHIPLLVEYSVFKERLDALRNHPRIKTLIERARQAPDKDTRHQIINASVSEQLNIFVKQIFSLKPISREGIKRARQENPNAHPEMLKDTRAIYARITYAEYRAKTIAAGKIPTEADKFFSDRLGHDSKATQTVYKQFTDYLKGFDPDAKGADKTAKSLKAESKEKVQEGPADRLEQLEKLFNKPEVKNSEAFTRYAEFVLNGVKKVPTQKVTSTWIKNELGGNKGIILKFVGLVKNAGLQKPL